MTFSNRYSTFHRITKYVTTLEHNLRPANALINEPYARWFTFHPFEHDTFKPLLSLEPLKYRDYGILRLNKLSAVSFNFQAAADKSRRVIADKDVYAFENELQLVPIKRVHVCITHRRARVCVYVRMPLLASRTDRVTRLASIITYGSR